MKHITKLITLACSVALATTAVADVNIGTVNMKSIFDNYYKTKEADAKLNEVRNAYQKELDEKSEKIKALETDITKDREELKKTEISDAKKAPIAKAQEKKLAEWQGAMMAKQKFQQEQGKQIEGQIMRIRSILVGDITKVVTARVKEKSYDLVLDTSGFSANNALPVVFFAKSGFDFTQDVITELNASKGTATEDKPITLDLAPTPAKPEGTAAKPETTPVKPEAPKKK